MSMKQKPPTTTKGVYSIEALLFYSTRGSHGPRGAFQQSFTIQEYFFVEIEYAMFALGILLTVSGDYIADRYHHH